jgi:hypothetical protein
MSPNLTSISLILVIKYHLSGIVELNISKSTHKILKGHLYRIKTK